MTTSRSKCPFPFWNPADCRFYVYYLGRQKSPPKQTGLLVGDGDFGQWTRVRQTSVIAAEADTSGRDHPIPSLPSWVTPYTLSTLESRRGCRPFVTQPRRSIIPWLLRKTSLILSSKVAAKHGTVAVSERQKSSLDCSISTSSTVGLMAKCGGPGTCGRATSEPSNPTRTILFSSPR